MLSHGHVFFQLAQPKYCIRFYEEGDAASLVIPRDSEFRKNIDWQDENFPREVESSHLSSLHLEFRMLEFVF